jgi:hypothetical protein
VSILRTRTLNDPPHVTYTGCFAGVAAVVSTAVDVVGVVVAAESYFDFGLAEGHQTNQNPQTRRYDGPLSE